MGGIWEIAKTANLRKMQRKDMIHLYFYLTQQGLLELPSPYILKIGAGIQDIVICLCNWKGFWKLPGLQIHEITIGIQETWIHVKLNGISGIAKSAFVFEIGEGIQESGNSFVEFVGFSESAKSVKFGNT